MTKQAHNAPAIAAYDRITSAAYDLLEAAESYINATTQNGLDAAIEKTKAAIAKAKGE